MHKAEVINQLQQLKNNINPHFLFNSLNSLYMLIGINKENAQKFTMNLSKIYRYLIVPPKENIVPVSQEISFIRKYMELLKSRFDEELSFELIINHEESLEKRFLIYPFRLSRRMQSSIILQPLISLWKSSLS